MANEELIYRLTKAVYGRLGAGADEQTVEQLVTEVYREVEPLLPTNGSAYASPPTFPASPGATTTGTTGIAADCAAAAIGKASKVASRLAGARTIWVFFMVGFMRG